MPTSAGQENPPRRDWATRPHSSRIPVDPTLATIVAAIGPASLQAGRRGDSTLGATVRQARTGVRVPNVEGLWARRGPHIKQEMQMHHVTSGRTDCLLGAKRGHRAARAHPAMGCDPGGSGLLRCDRQRIRKRPSCCVVPPASSFASPPRLTLRSGPPSAIGTARRPGATNGTSAADSRPARRDQPGHPIR